MQKLLLCASLLGIVVSIVGTRVEASNARRVQTLRMASGEGYSCSGLTCNEPDSCTPSQTNGTSYKVIYYPKLVCTFNYNPFGSSNCTDSQSGMCYQLSQWTNSNCTGLSCVLSEDIINHCN